MAVAGEEAESSAAAGERPRVPFARGGPVFVPFMVGPISTVPEFMSSTLREVQSLRDELGDPGDEFEDELCIDELKVLSEEELVERALREAMEEDRDSGAQPELVNQRSGTPLQPSDQRFDGGMPASSTRGNETVTSSASVETQNSTSPLDDMAIGLGEPPNNGKRRAEKRKIRKRKEKNGAITSDSTAERETSGSPFDMAMVAYEPQGSKGKPRGRKTKNGTISNSSIGSGAPVSPSEDISVVPHDLEGADEQTKRRKGKKRGRHFDREVRAHILQGRYLSKAEKMAEIKIKQEEDKRGARLHSFRLTPPTSIQS